MLRLRSFPAAYGRCDDTNDHRTGRNTATGGPCKKDINQRGTWLMQVP
jgi:hypothetical protein